MPKHPLSEPIIMDYRDPISRLARRFFHHLLRQVVLAYYKVTLHENYGSVYMYTLKQGLMLHIYTP